jgi:hypothetical protein
MDNDDFIRYLSNCQLQSAASSAISASTHIAPTDKVLADIAQLQLILTHKNIGTYQTAIMSVYWNLITTHYGTVNETSVSGNDTTNHCAAYLRRFEQQLKATRVPKELMTALINGLSKPVNDTSSVPHCVTGLPQTMQQLFDKLSRIVDEMQIKIRNAVDLGLVIPDTPKRSSDQNAPEGTH